jgi:hypothetical protein
LGFNVVACEHGQEAWNHYYRRRYYHAMEGYSNELN